MALKSSKKIVLLSAAFAVGLTMAPAAVSWAAGGGGGGGGSPSQSAPSYDPAEEYRKGLTALEAEEYSDAQRAFKRVLRVAPKDANTHYLLGVSYMRAGNFKKARKPLQSAVKHAPNMVLARRDLAITYAKIDKMPKAQETLDGLIMMQADCGGTCPEKDAIAQAIDAAKAEIGGLAQSQFGPDTRTFSDASTGDALYSDAVGLINEGRYELALVSLDKAALAFGPHPDILTYQGFANRKLSRYDVAESYYSSALAIAPDHLGALEYYGELKLERGDMAGAKQHLARLRTLCSFGCYEADELGRWISESDKVAQDHQVRQETPSV